MVGGGISLTPAVRSSAQILAEAFARRLCDCVNCHVRAKSYLFFFSGSLIPSSIIDTIPASRAKQVTSMKIHVPITSVLVSP